MRQSASWDALYGRNVIGWISVNVSARQFDEPGPLLEALAETERIGLSPDRVQIEITETSFMRNVDATRRVLEQLHALGVHIAIDDFGTGYSALNVLGQYPIDTVKIDSGFVGELETEQGEKLAQALLSIARLYGAAVIAEGIETAAQRDILQASGCGYGQGFFFAEPMTGADLGAYALTHAAAVADSGDGRAAAY
jgi:EAL domain-containing protein (putative c-di-GMP-specific phosphodiesterase class I)